MKGWDFWEKTGSAGGLTVAGAAPAPRSQEADPTRANIDPTQTTELLSSGQRPWQVEESGVLQLFVDGGGRLLQERGYGMRLDNVGPEVRRRVAQLGLVRDLPVNKTINVCSVQSKPLAIIASVLVTADGYVRATNWAAFQTAHIGHHEPPGPGRLRETHDCLEDLIQGSETNDCRLTPEVDAASIVKLVDRVQSLSLALLEV
jgi:hypothetical protein